jgi:hypothetical protein
LLKMSAIDNAIPDAISPVFIGNMGNLTVPRTRNNCPLQTGKTKDIPRPLAMRRLNLGIASTHRGRERERQGARMKCQASASGPYAFNRAFGCSDFGRSDFGS